MTTVAKEAVDFTNDAWTAFLTGRNIIANNKEISGDLLNRLKEQRDKAVLAWEKSIVATIVHYINDVLQDMAKIGDANYSFLSHAKHWSEMKGFALYLQFNPRSKVSTENFAAMHTKMGEAPLPPPTPCLRMIEAIEPPCLRPERF